MEKVRKITKKNKLEILRILEEHYKGTGSALKYQTPFQLLVYTALDAQTTDVQVNKVAEKLYADYPDAKAMATLTPEELIPYIQTLGLYRNKAKNVVALAQKLMTDFDGVVPRTREELTTLPGVGRKTANVVLSNAFGIPAMAVDTHVFRVSNRMGLAQAKTPEGVEEQICALIPKEKWGDAHHWLIWHGRRCCKAQKPSCGDCPVMELCPSRQA